MKGNGGGKERVLSFPPPFLSSPVSRCHPSGLNNPCAKTSEAQLLARTSRRLFSSSLRSKYFDAAEPTPPLWHGRRGIHYLCRPMLTPGCGFAVCRRICVRFHQICSGYRWCRGPGPSRCSILGNQVMPTGAGQRESMRKRRHRHRQDTAPESVLTWNLRPRSFSSAGNGKSKAKMGMQRTPSA
jgi:hypothetical protein